MALSMGSKAHVHAGVTASQARLVCVRRPVAARAAKHDEQPPSAAVPRRAALVAIAAAPAAGLVRVPLAAAEAACTDLRQQAAAAPRRAAPRRAARTQIDTPSGLKYCEIAEGTGKEPVKGALIRAHYTGRLASNGKVFDSSYTRGRPLTFKVGAREVIRGWDLGILGDEGIPPMKEGGKRLLVIPSDLAYGDRGAGGVIPGGATLEFEVELLGRR
ncbi:FKBP-type peptidyl-prolyl cis-trans isomerase [Monoraphidium neglectum]|uniref:peptidylprolyl isomerase n=1 Tax=Monoraphidium neglectum TaxID=145388 RepID=A0A0D2L1I4_9CHLO|nr:FKBP-type peptidyl-prolyl cis-trans isomerase [Monoraphidium neglectum]KIZ01189.1 FKBP-type peptidyl-prolyl cis-trans isomerase [Monoraphidium neglectum]|eukprot:XP_013900208.1 FKBP-type peptidyl-prolyl cis-trans isomerase [Monoraphidium neglectum]